MAAVEAVAPSALDRTVEHSSSTGQSALTATADGVSIGVPKNGSQRVTSQATGEQ
jgi:hypothetical protein